MKILVVQTAFIGDVILTTAFIHALRQIYSNAEIHFLTTQAGREVLKGDEQLHLHVLDKKNLSKLQSIFTSVKDLSANSPYDYIFCLHRSFRSLLIAKLVNAKRKFAFRSFFSALFSFETVSYPGYSEKLHYSEKLLSMLSLIDLKSNLAPSPKPNLQIVSSTDLSKKIPFTEKQWIALSPFSVWGTKMWPFEKFKQLALKLAKTHPVVFIGEHYPRLSDELDLFCKTAAENGLVISNLTGKTDLQEMLALIKGSCVLVSNDSAPIHAAAAFDVPTVAIFGPTHAKWGFFPLASKSTIVEKSREDVPCRPCHIHGPVRCPLQHFRCMEEIGVELVLHSVEKYLKHL